MKFSDPRDSAIKNALDKLLSILQELVNLARSGLAAAGGPPGQLVTATVSYLADTDALRRLNDVLQSFITSTDQIGFAEYAIPALQIRSAFSTEANVQGFPAGASPSNWDFVTDRAEQKGQIFGDGAEYIVWLRYERHKMN